MLGVIWVVLKIILLIIGLILGIVLLFLSVLLFSSIRYSFFAQKDENTDIKGRVSWLFGIVKAEYISNDEDSELILKYPFKKKEKVAEPTEDNAVYIQQLSEDTEGEDIKEPDIAVNTAAEKSYGPQSEIPVHEEEIKNFGIGERIKNFGIKEKIQNIINAVKRKITGFKDLISRLKEYKDFISDISGRYDIKGIIEKTIALVRKLFENIGFKVFEINGIIGFEDPSLTGRVLGALAAANCIIPADIDIDGDFENKRLEGSIDLSGKTCIFRLLLPVALYLLRKPVRPVVIDFIRGDKNE